MLPSKNPTNRSPPRIDDQVERDLDQWKEM